MPLNGYDANEVTYFVLDSHVKVMKVAIATVNIPDFLFSVVVGFSDGDGIHSVSFSLFLDNT